VGFLDKAVKATPAGGAISAVVDLFGGGPSSATIWSRKAREQGHAAVRGDVGAVAYLYQARLSRFEPVRRVARNYLLELAKGVMTGGGRSPIAPGTKVPPAVSRAAKTALHNMGVEGWESPVNGNGPAPIAANGSTPTTTRTSVPSAPRAPKPCRYGPRDPVTGRCPPKPKAERVGGVRAPFTGARPSRPCKYGPRGEDGLCPKKPSGLARGKLSKRDAALLRKAQTAAGNVLAKGARGAVRAVGAGMTASGVTAGAAATTVAAVAVAGALGWFIGQALLNSGADREQQRADLAVNRIHARLALQQKLGRMPTLAEQKPITDEYNNRLKLLR